MTYQQLALIIGEEYGRHKYLLEGSTLNVHEQAYFEKIRQNKATFLEISSSLEMLAKFLQRYYQKKVILLIDEYDVPVQSGYIHGFYDEILQCIQNIVSSILKDNPYLEKGVLSGILTLANAGLFSGLNNVTIFNLTHPFFAVNLALRLKKQSSCFLITK